MRVLIEGVTARLSPSVLQELRERGNGWELGKEWKALESQSVQS